MLKLNAYLKEKIFNIHKVEKMQNNSITTQEVLILSLFYKIEVGPKLNSKT